MREKEGEEKVCFELFILHSYIVCGDSVSSCYVVNSLDKHAFHCLSEKRGVGLCHHLHHLPIAVQPISGNGLLLLLAFIAAQKGASDAVHGEEAHVSKAPGFGRLPERIPHGTANRARDTVAVVDFYGTEHRLGEKAPDLLSVAQLMDHCFGHYCFFTETDD